jgi:hypothetical protein
MASASVARYGKMPLVAARARSPVGIPFAGLADRRHVAFLGQLLRALEAKFPRALRTRVDRERQAGFVELVGTGKRRLPGMRRDQRPHVLRAAYDGRFLVASFEVEGDLKDTLSIAAPTSAALDEVAGFFARHAARVWWKGRDEEPERRQASTRTRKPP